MWFIWIEASVRVACCLQIQRVHRTAATTTKIQITMSYNSGSWRYERVLIGWANVEDFPPVMFYMLFLHVCNIERSRGEQREGEERGWVGRGVRSERERGDSLSLLLHTILPWRFHHHYQVYPVHYWMTSGPNTLKGRIPLGFDEGTLIHSIVHIVDSKGDQIWFWKDLFLPSWHSWEDLLEKK